MTAAGVFLLAFLAGLKPDGSKAQDAPQAEGYLSNSGALSGTWLFPILAVLVIFWTNSFTDQLFCLPSINTYGLVLV